MSESAKPAIESWPRLIALIACTALLAFSYGYAMPAFALVLEHRGIDSTLIGLNTGAQNIAILFVGPFLPKIIRLAGVRRLIYAVIALGVASILALMAVEPPYAWFPFRILQGGSLYIAFIAGETWIAQGAGDERRGRVVGLYASVAAAGIFAGPLLVQVTGVEGATPFLVAAGLTAAAALPLLFLRGSGPSMDQPLRGGFLTFLAMAPTMMGAALLYGVVDAALLSMLPIYGLHSGLPEETAVLLLIIWIAGAITLQFPLSRLGDRLGRRPMLIACGSLSLAATILIPVFIGGGAMLWIALFVSGGAIMGLWTISMAALGDRFYGAELAMAMTVDAMVYAVGATGGPSIAGWAMQAWEPHGMMAVLGFFSALFVGLAVLRAFRRARS